jgi:hypothetical protein
MSEPTRDEIKQCAEILFNALCDGYASDPANKGTVNKIQRVIEKHTASVLAEKEAEIAQTRDRGNNLARQLDKLLNYVKAVTAFHCHGVEIPKQKLDDLSNIQIEVEKARDKMRVPLIPPSA